MPSLPRLRVSALQALADQLRFAPRETARRHVERAESLAERITPDGVYPEDWLVFQVTGYRPETPEPALLPGEALLADLGALVERLSAAGGWTAAELGRDGWINAAELARRWGVSRRSVERYRRLGLIGRRATPVRGAPGHLFYRPGMVERFEAARSARLARARAFSRMDEALESRLVARYRRYHERLGWSVSRAAARLAERFGRSPEGIRALLLRHQRSAGAPPARPARAPRRARPSRPAAATERSDGPRRGMGPGAAAGGAPGPLDGRSRRLAERALRRGVAARRVALRLGRSEAAVRRAALLHRVEMLRRLPLATPADDLLAGAEAALLTPAVVREGLGEPGAPTLQEHQRRTALRGWPDAAEEAARAKAFCLLRRQAALALAKVDRLHPSAVAVDEVERLLLWAARLKAELVRGQGLLLLRTVESHFGRGLESLPAAAGAGLLLAGLAAVGEAVDRHDPFRGGRLAAPAGLALNRVVAKFAQGQLRGPGGPGEAAAAGGTTRAAPIRVPERAEAALPDWTRTVAPWQAFLEADPRLAGVLPRLAPPHATLLAARFGFGAFGGGAPASLRALAAAWRVPVHVIARRERGAMQAARLLWRAGAP